MSRIARNKLHYDLQSKKSWDSVFLTYQQFISIIAQSNEAQKFWFQKLNQAFTNRYKQITVNCRNLHETSKQTAFSVPQNLCMVLIPLCKNNLNMLISHTDHYALRKKKTIITAVF